MTDLTPISTPVSVCIHFSNAQMVTDRVLISIKVPSPGVDQ